MTNLNTLKVKNFGMRLGGRNGAARCSYRVFMTTKGWSLVIAFLSVWLQSIYSIDASAQATVTTTTNFTSSSFPTGWSSAIGSGSYNWALESSGSSPSASPNSPSTYIAWYNSFSASSGSYAVLYTPVLDFSSRNSYTTTMTCYIYRDASAYNTTSYNARVSMCISILLPVSQAPLCWALCRAGVGRLFQAAM